MCRRKGSGRTGKEGSDCELHDKKDVRKMLVKVRQIW